MKAQSFFLSLIPIIMVLFPGCKLERVEPQCPTITSLQPNAARLDEIVSIKGKNFYVGSPELYKILIDDKSVDVLDVPDSSTIRFKVPQGIGTGTVSVTLASGLGCNQGQNLTFTYYYTASKVNTLNSDVNFPRGIDLDHLGRLIVSDNLNYQIKIIDLATNTVTVNGKGQPMVGCDMNPTDPTFAHFSPTDIEVDLSGNIYIPEPSYSMIRWIDSRSDSVRIFAGLCRQPGTSISPIQRLDAKLTNPYSVARDDNTNSLYFTDDRGIRKSDSVGVVQLHKLHPSEGKFTGLDFSRSRKDTGPIFVIDIGDPPRIDPSIRSFDEAKNEKKINLIPSLNNLITPFALSVDGKGNIFVADFSANKIFVLYTNGYLDVLAGKGIAGHNENVAGKDAMFNGPAGIALSEKNGVLDFIYVSDGLNDKIKAIQIE